MKQLSVQKLSLLGFITVLLAAIPLTIFLIHKQQQTQSSAIASTVLSFSPATQNNVSVGSTVPFDIMLDPGQNQVSFVKLKITYDNTKLSLTPTAIVNGTALPFILEAPAVGTDGTATISISAGANPTSIVTKKIKIATITFTALAATTTPVQVAFAAVPATQVLSAGSDATSNENVLSTTSPATVTIGGTTGTTATPTASPTTTGGTGGTGTTTTPPTCTGLTADRALNGAAPVSITFAASGTSTTSTISKVTFNFGDTQVTDVTVSGGIGTNSVSNAKAAHTYNNPGTYTATAIMTDNTGQTSTPATCTQTVTVTAASTGSQTGGGVVAAPTTQAAPLSPKAPLGPGDTFLKAGAIGGIISIIGAILFFAL